MNSEHAHTLFDDCKIVKTAAWPCPQAPPSFQCWTTKLFNVGSNIEKLGGAWGWGYEIETTVRWTLVLDSRFSEWFWYQASHSKSARPVTSQGSTGYFICEHTFTQQPEDKVPVGPRPSASSQTFSQPTDVATRATRDWEGWHFSPQFIRACISRADLKQEAQFCTETVTSWCVTVARCLSSRIRIRTSEWA